ncbi:MAG: BatA domain-containing protein [Luteolibacter sp.]
MSLFLQTPALLGLLALAALPAIVHLLSRARPPEYRFSNIEFLRRVIRRTARIRRPKDWLLLLIRTVALTAFAAAFLLPLLVSKNIALPGEASTAIILIDRSASMSAREGAGSRFDAACAEAATFLETAKPTAANLIWIDAEPAAIFPEPGPNLTFLTEQIQTAESRLEEGALAAAIDIALRQLATSQGRRQLVIISDFQAATWRDFSPAMPPGVEIITRQIAAESPANFAVTRLLAQPAAPVTGQDATLLANIRNFSPDPVHTQLTLDADGSRQSQPIDLPPWGEVEAAFTLRPATAGPLAVTASIDGDSFPADNARHTVIHVREAIRLHSGAGSLPAEASGEGRVSPAALILAKITTAIPWLEPTESPTTGDITLNPPTTEIPALTASGVTVILASPADATAIQSFIPAGTTPRLQTNPDGWQILPDERHPAIRLFSTGDFGNPFTGVFRERLDLPESLARHDHVRQIAVYQDGVPAILEIRTDGAPILFFNLPLDPAKTDWPTHGVFLPAIAEIILRTRPAERAESAHASPGTRIDFLSTRTEDGGTIDLLGPAGTPWPLRETTSADGTRWQSEAPAVPGLFRWQTSGQSLAITAVNFPESQSDLRPLDTPPTFDGAATTTDSFERRAALARGVPLWPWLIAAALACLLLESLIHLRSRQTAIPTSNR